MLSKYKQKRDQGFTIIEVLIVLAIAGLIMLVVFLAIPALQRNSRNTQRTNDVANLLGGVGEYVANNNGVLPGVDSDGLGATGATTASIGTGNSVDVDLGYYTANSVTIADFSTATNGTTEDTVQIVRGAVCNGSNPADGASRAYVALYTLESDAKQCRES